MARGDYTRLEIDETTAIEGQGDYTPRTRSGLGVALDIWKTCIGNDPFLEVSVFYAGCGILFSLRLCEPCLQRATTP